MGEVVSLRRVRKARQRAEDAAVAARNRAVFGRGKAQRALEVDSVERRERHLDGHARSSDPPAPDRDGGG